MFQAGKLDNVIQEMDNMNFDVLGLCETIWENLHYNMVMGKLSMKITY